MREVDSPACNVLILGSGGREHAIAMRLLACERVGRMYALPGNPGMQQGGVECLAGAANDFARVRAAILEHGVHLLVIGPEGPLVEGLADRVRADAELQHVLVVGPGQAGAQLEGSKSFAKAFMMRHAIPTARYAAFHAGQSSEAKAFLRQLPAPYVLKADGLAAGKGVLIVPTLPEAEEALDTLFAGQFGAASECVVIEEFLHGIELSVFALCDGHDYVLLPAAKDYKQAYDGNRGPNTGGMGSVSPVPFADAEFMRRVEERIVAPTVCGLAAEGVDYRGFIFFGLMRSPEGDPYVIEYNARLGDPETQVVLPRVEGDFLAVLCAAAAGKLATSGVGRISISPRSFVSVSLVSQGYPGAYGKGMPIRLPDPEHWPSQTHLIHAGTRVDGSGVLRTDGGRVFSCVGQGENLSQARAAAYALAEGVEFEGKQHRSDIGMDIIGKERQ